MGPKAVQKGGLFPSFLLPPHEDEALPEALEVAVPVGRVDHGLGDVVPRLHLGVGERPAELVLREAPGYLGLPFPVRRRDLRQGLAAAVVELLRDEPDVLHGPGERVLNAHVPVEALEAVVRVPQVRVERQAAPEELVVVPRAAVRLPRVPPVRDVPPPREEQPPPLYRLWTMQDADPHAGHVGDFLASQAS